MTALEAVRIYIMNEGEIALFPALEHLESIGIKPSEAEVEEISSYVDSLNYESYLFRSLRMRWETERYNRLRYGV